MAIVFEINKGVNKAIEFRGIKAQYIVYLALGLVSLLFLFAICYFIGVPTYITVVVVIALGYFLFSWVTNVSKKYGEHGLMKAAAFKKIPAALVCRSRKCFVSVKKKEVCDDSSIDDDSTGCAGGNNSSAKDN